MAYKSGTNVEHMEDYFFFPFASNVLCQVSL